VTSEVTKLNKKMCRFLILLMSLLSVDGFILRDTVTRAVASPWPMPASYLTTPTWQSIDSSDFQFKTTDGHSCDLMEAAFVRYYDIMFGGPRQRIGNDHPSNNNAVKFMKQEKSIGLALLNVILANECEVWPSLNMDESC